MNNELLNIILSSALISSIITAVFSYAQNNNKNKVEYIAKHRIETDNSKLLRETISQIYEAKNIGELSSYLPNIKRCLNPYYFIDKIPINDRNGKCADDKQFTSEDIEHDVLIWDLIYKLETLNEDDKYYNNKFDNYKIKLALYISCSLKFDWDRYQQEINSQYKGNYKNNLYDAVKKIFYYDNVVLQNKCKTMIGEENHIVENDDKNEDKISNHKIKYVLKTNNLYLNIFLLLICIIIYLFFNDFLIVYENFVIIIFLCICMFIEIVLNLNIIYLWQWRYKIHFKFIIEFITKIIIIVSLMTLLNKYIINYNFKNNTEKKYNTVNIEEIDINIATYSYIK